MKNKLILILLSLLMIPLFSCEKIEFKNDISGTWEILFAEGGLFPHSIETNYSHLRLKKGDHYFIFNHDTLKAKGEFTIYKSGYGHYQNAEPYFIKLRKCSGQDPNLKFPIDVNLDVRFYSNDTLILYDRGIADGNEYCFIRSK
jgi:hypothetical protein